MSGSEPAQASSGTLTKLKSALGLQSTQPKGPAPINTHKPTSHSSLTRQDSFPGGCRMGRARAWGADPRASRTCRPRTSGAQPRCDDRQHAPALFAASCRDLLHPQRRGHLRGGTQQVPQCRRHLLLAQGAARAWRQARPACAASRPCLMWQLCCPPPAVLLRGAWTPHHATQRRGRRSRRLCRRSWGGSGGAFSGPAVMPQPWPRAQAPPSPC